MTAPERPPAQGGYVELGAWTEMLFVIPGEPVAQGRPRAFRRGAGVALVDPTKSRSWKAYASGIYLQQLERLSGCTIPLFAPGVPVEVSLTAVFACPASQHRKREPVKARPKLGKPDVDNLLKAALDAANGLLWVDDAQVVRAVVRKVVGAQGEAPRVELSVRELVSYEEGVL